MKCPSPEVETGAEEQLETSGEDPPATALRDSFDYGETLVRAAEDLTALLESFASVLRQMRKALPLLGPLCQCVPDELQGSLLFQQIHQLADIAPCIIEMYEKELSFKRDSIEQIALSDDPTLSSAILSSWKNHVYVEPGPLSLLYALVV